MPASFLPKKSLVLGPYSVHALLHQDKTELRRPVKDLSPALEGVQALPADKLKRLLWRCPYGQENGRLYVREDWKPAPEPDGDNPTSPYRYRADTILDQPGPTDWLSAREMPRQAVRLRLQLTGVRVERLHQMSAVDAIAEGIGSGFTLGPGWPDYQSLTNGEALRCDQPTPLASYATLWESLYGPNAWITNPWVYALTFKVLPAKTTKKNRPRKNTTHCLTEY